MATEIKTVTFQWSTEHGECYDCGNPAAFISDEHNTAPENLRCAVCAANDAAAGAAIRRIDPESDAPRGEAIVRYRVPLYVHVDLDGRTVTRVVIGDEETGLPEAVIEGGYPALAFSIAESADWPAWEAGY